MFERAVVGIDLSPAGDVILDWVEDFARLGVRRLTLVYALNSNSRAGLPRAYAGMFADLLRHRATCLRDRGIAAEAQIRFGAPADEILAVAEEIAADVVVIGSRSHSAAHNLIYGSTAREVIARSPIPVLLEHVGLSAIQTQKDKIAICHCRTRSVLLLTDTTSGSAGVEITAKLIPQHADHFVVLHVLPEGAGPTATMTDEAMSRLRSMFGAKVSIRVERGDVPSIAALVAREEKTTLVAMGRRYKDWLEEKVSHRLCEEVCKATRVPILVVPSSADRMAFTQDRVYWVAAI